MSLSLSDPSLLKSQAYVDGQWIDADDGATFPVTNPANGELFVYDDTRQITSGACFC